MEILKPAFYLTAGFMVFVGIQSAFLAFWGIMRPVLGHFAVMCLAAAGYQLFSGLLHGSHSSDSAVSILHWHIFSIAVFFPAFVGYVCHYSGDRFSQRWVWGASLYSALLVFADWWLEFGLRFQSVEGLKLLHLPWGESISIIDGRVAPSAFALNVIGLFILLISFYRAIVLFRNGRVRQASVFLVYVAIFLTAMAYGVAAKRGLAPYIYIAGFGFLALTLFMAIGIAQDMRNNVHLLGVQREQLHTERSITEVLRQDQARLSQVFAQSPNSIYLIDGSGQLIHRNSASRRFYNDGIERQGLFFQASPWKELNLSSEFNEVVQNGQVRVLQLEVPHQHLVDRNRNAWVNITIFPASESSGYIDAVALISEDITRQHYMDSSLKMVASGASFADSTEFFERLARQVAELYVCDYVFVAARNKLNYSTLAVFKDGIIDDNFRESITGSFVEEVFQQGLVSFSNKAKEHFPDDNLLKEWDVESVVAVPLNNANEESIGLIAALNRTPSSISEDLNVIFDIFTVRASAELQRRDAESRIRRMAYEDYITSLPNRAMLNEELTKVIALAREKGGSAAAYFLDVDHFKTINDALGHDVGDDVLRRIGARLRSSFDEEVFIARMGGDEFVLLDQLQGEYATEEETLEYIKSFASKIIEAMSRPLSLGNRIISIGTSVGVVRIPEDADTELAAMGRADIALYEAKQSGRNCFEIYNPSMQKDVDARLEMEKGLRVALQKNHFTVYYQPKVDADKKMIGAEALLRWKHPEHGFISPAEFIPVAEETGLIHLIGEWVILAVCEQLQEWRDKGIDIPGDISINISAWQFAKPDFADNLIKTVRRFGLSKKDISIEMTETAILRDINLTKEKLSVLREVGFVIALDDFGTGYSSLAYLKNLPLDIFKIDRAFVEDLRNRQTEGLVASMIAIGQHMRLQVIAEGVEKEDEMKTLMALGCERFQGFLFARPMPADDFLNWMRTNNS